MHLRILHFSDIHLEAPSWFEVPPSDWLGKRIVGGLNLWLRRRAHHRDAPAKLDALHRLIEEQRVDLLVCTGDYTALGTWPELRFARRRIAPLAASAPMGLLTVPGNHDVYLTDARRDRRFERLFWRWLHTDLPAWRAGDGPFPAVRLLGKHLAIVAIDSSRPNPQPWKSSGRIPESQLRSLSALLTGPLASRYVLLATHYAPRLPDGRPDAWRHGLENAEALLEACCIASGRLALLHGHIHHRFALRRPILPVDVFGAGSLTHAGREGLWLFQWDDAQQRGEAIPGHWSDGRYTLEPNEALRLP